MKWQPYMSSFVSAVKLQNCSGIGPERASGADPTRRFRSVSFVSNPISYNDETQDGPHRSYRGQRAAKCIPTEIKLR